MTRRNSRSPWPKLATELGLEPAPPPAPLPVIELEDVHLVCWMAIANEA